MPTLNELSRLCHQNAINKGFFDEGKNTGEMIALMHSELSEALEADRKDSYVRYHSMDAINGWIDDEDFKRAYKKHVKGSFEEEMADILIRVFDMCGYKNIDIDAHVKAKMRYNSLRERMHSKKY